MADNTLQFDWIERIKGGCDALFAEKPDVFVAGDLLWYPVLGHPEIRIAPDVMVVLGRPKGYRGSYKQWEEDNIPPQVVFEILSPGNRFVEMVRKLELYARFGVEEYYVYNPHGPEFTALLRQGSHLTPIEFTGRFTSPRLDIRFELFEDAEELTVYRPDGRRFLSFTETEQERAAAEALAQSERERAQVAMDRVARLAARLQELGIDPAEV
jgi:Uma2 family endonuclease